MEELKYKVEFETDPIKPSELVSTEAIQALVQLNQQIDEYKAQLKDLESKEKEQGQLTKDQAEQQQQLKLNLKATQDQYARINREIQNHTKAANENTNTYQGLVNENKRLMDAMRNLSLDDTTGELQRLQEQYNRNNDTLKEFDAKLGNHQRNVGNYGSALSGLGGQLGKLPGPIGAGATAFMGLNATMKANPYGAVIALVVELIGALSKFQPVVDFLSKSMAILSNTFKFFIDKAGGFLGLVEQTDQKLGDVIAKTAALADAEVKLRDAKREQIVAVAEQQKRISELMLIEADRSKTDAERLAAIKEIEKIQGDAIKEKMDIAKEELRIAEQNAELNHSDAATLENIAKLRAEVLNLETQSNNFLKEIITKRTELENKEQAEKERLEKEAEDRRKKAADQQKRRNDEIAAQSKKLRDEAELLDKDQFEVQRILAERQFQENVKLLKQGTDAYNDALRIRDAAFKKIEADQQKIKEENDKKEVERAQQQAQKLMALDALRTQTQTDIALSKLQEQNNLVLAEEMRKQMRIQELQKMFEDAGLNAYQANLRAEEQATLEYISKIDAARKQQAENQKKSAEEQLELERNITTQKIDLASQAANSVISIGKSIFGETKALAVAQAIIDTLGAAVSVMRDTKGPLWVRLLSAAAITAQGFANVKKILSTKPGGGSASGGGGMAGARPSMSSTAVTPAGSLVSQDFARASIAGQVATDATSRNMADRPVQVMANVDRRGLAIAVREGERSIRTQQFDYK
jgi:hypothetical protein